MPLDKFSYVLSDRGQFVTDGDPATTTTADMDDAFARFKQQRDANGTTLVAFFHGGLVDENSFMKDSAPTLIQTYSANGKGFPYLFVWRSGPGETIMDWARDHLGGLMSNSKVTDAVRAADTESQKPEYKAALTTKTFSEFRATNAPPAAQSDSADMQKKLTATYRKDPKILALQALFDGNPSAQMKTMSLVSRRGGGATMSDEEVAGTVRAALAAPQAAGERMMALPIGIDIPALLAAATVRVVWRNIHHRNHPGVSTMSEEVARVFGVALLGQQLWDEMKNDCANAFNATGVGTAFIQRLKTLAADGKPLRVLLIGHSAGTIYVDELMNAIAVAQMPGNVTFDIVYMAAAIRSDKFSALLQAPVATRINHFRSFALHDVAEQKCPLSEGASKLVDAIFPETLLYVIAGILEPEPQVDVPLAGMDRFIGVDTRFAGEAGDQVIINYATHARPAVWSPTDSAAQLGYACGATTHGGFPLDSLALKSVATLINGWV